jgi:glycosyltransferase involved in cell wall biosynthesis
MELTILMPCLNEELTVASCVSQARAFLEQSAIDGEVIVADNGSTDRSVERAQAAGARIVRIPTKGYGRALWGGIQQAQGRYVIFGDADQSYDFSSLAPFVERLRAGDQLVMGDRFAGGIRPGAMPVLHRYLGNPVLSFLGRLFFSSKVRDFHCGLRGFDRAAMLSLGLASPGMEFASEMIVKATLGSFSISNVPTVLSPDGRDRPPHLRSWRDGWRHLRFLLMMSPRWLMLYPGFSLISLGLVAEIAILRGPIVIRGIGFDIHSMLYASGLTIFGLQLVLFSILARTIGSVMNVLPTTPYFRTLLRAFTLERGIVLGAAIALAGLGLGIYSVKLWAATRLSALDPAAMMRIAIPSVTLMLAGGEIVFASFLMGFMDVRLDETPGRVT